MTTRTNIAGTTAAEAEVLAATAAALAAGGDPFGDDDEDDAADAADEDTGNPAPGAELSAGDETTGDELSAEALAAIADEPHVPAQAAPRYKAGDPADFATQRAALNAEKAKGLKDLMDGVIEPEAYSAIEAGVSEKLDALTVRRTLHEANVQTEQQTHDSALEALMTAAKKAGEVDYAADPKAAKQFDAAMTMLAEPGDTRTYADQVADAHKAVLAIRGIKPAPPTAAEVAATAAAAAAALAAKPRENGKGPMTLRNVPAAATPNTGGGWQEQIAGLTGQEFEAAFAQLTQAQKAHLLAE
jgi:hypothetical protein